MNAYITHNITLIRSIYATMRIIKGDINVDTTMQLVLHEMANIETGTYTYDVGSGVPTKLVKPVRGYPNYQYGNQTFTVRANIGYIFIPNDVSISLVVMKLYKNYPSVISELIPEFATGRKIDSVRESNGSIDVMKKKKIRTQGFAYQGNLSQYSNYNSVIVSNNFYKSNLGSINAKFIWIVDHAHKISSSETDLLLASVMLDTYDCSMYKHCQLVDQFDLSNLKPINDANFTITICKNIHPTLVELEYGITSSQRPSRYMSQSIKCKRIRDLMTLGINAVLPDVCEHCHLPFIGDTIVAVARRGEPNYKFVCQRCVCCNRAKLHGAAYDYNIIKSKRSIPELINEYIADVDKRNILLGLDTIQEVECDPRFGYYYRIHHTATGNGDDTVDKKYLLVSGLELFMLSGKADQFADYLIVKYEITSG
ncbi:hypothetical protein F-E9_419 [Faustovirus]|nr:hypothetical protein F-E9_419 [Faustovirus]